MEWTQRCMPRKKRTAKSSSTVAAGNKEGVDITGHIELQNEKGR